MHRFFWTVVTTLPLVSSACGGNSPSPKDPAPPSATSSEEAHPAVAASAGAPSTTLDGLSDAGTGAKLPPAGEGAGHRSSEAGRGAKDIQAIVVSRRAEARACYDAALARNAGIEGDIDIKWTIDPKGNVTDIDVDPSKTTIMEPSVGKCLIELIRKIKFAESPKGFETKTHYPYNFHPKLNQVASDGGVKK